MTQRLFDTYLKVPKLVSHLHLPVQAGSDRVLAAMKRGYTALEYKSIIRKLRAARPDISLSSDFIVGFPGETDEDFEKTMKLIEEIGFDTSFSFIYSPRPGTPALELADDTPAEFGFLRGKGFGDLLPAEALGSRMAMTQRGVPLVEVSLAGSSERECGRLIQLLEMTTLFTGWLMSIDPLDQPAVELGKRLAKARLGADGLAQEKADLAAFLGAEHRTTGF